MNIKFIVNKSELLYNSLKNNELDFVIGLTPLNDNDLTIKPLYYEPILIVTTENIKKTNSTEIELSDIDTNCILVTNKENEFRYIGDELGYTQGVGISYQVDFETFRELIAKIVKTKKEDLALINKEIIDNYNAVGVEFIDKN